MKKIKDAVQKCLPSRRKHKRSLSSNDAESRVQSYLKKHQKEDDLQLILPQTHFNPIEFKLLKQYFQSLCNDPEELYLKPQQCKELFFGQKLKELDFVFSDEDEFVLNAIFNAVNTDGDGMVSFAEFVIALSIAIHGNFEEKASFSFRLYDANGDGELSVQEMVQYTRILQRLGVLKMESHLQNRVSRGDQEQAELERIIASPTKPLTRNEAVFDDVIILDTRNSTTAVQSPDIPSEQPKIIPADVDSSLDTQSHTSFHSDTASANNYNENEFPSESASDVIGNHDNDTVSESFVPSVEEINKLIADFFGTKQLLSYKEYVERSKAEKYLMEGLGIYDYVFYPLYKPIKRFLMREDPYEITGDLTHSGRLYAAEIRGGIFYLKDKVHGKVHKIINLDKVKSVIHEERDRFSLKIGRKTLKFSSEEPVQNFVFCVNMNLISHKDNRFGSFAPVRQNSLIHPLVDGKETFAAIAKAMLAAKSEIFIAGWCVSPYIYLIRDKDTPNLVQYRLDQILCTMAKKGVKIYVVIWNETSLAGMNLSSMKTFHMLSEMHSNIHVVAHPRITPFMWTHHQKIVVVDQICAFVGGLDLTWGRYDTAAHEISDNCALNPKWPGNDYCNLSVSRNLAMKLKIDVFRDTIDRDRYPREPWHDIHCVVFGRIATDVASNFITRWNHHTGLSLSRKSPVESDSLDMGQGSALELRSCSDTDFTKGPSHYLSSFTLYPAKAQILRSISTWSGSMRTEQSIHSAYLELIKNAKYYIYIENQYFCSQTPQSTQIENLVAQAIIERVSKAIASKEVFRVYIFIPMHSSGDPLDSSVQQVLKWQRRTICGIFDTLKTKFPQANIDNYITFLSLCSYGFILDNLHFNQIYIHSKMLIVDDKYAIIGSANINDRSMVGSRDSEIAVIIEDKDTSQTFMNSKLVRVGRSVKHLRLKLWREHLGIESSDQPLDGNTEEILHKVRHSRMQQNVNMSILSLAMKDPLSEYTYNHIRRIASENSKIFETVFDHYPSERHGTISDYKKDLEKFEAAVNHNIPNPHLKKLPQIKGHIVQYPLKWLHQDKLKKDIKLQVIEDRLFY